MRDFVTEKEAEGRRCPYSFAACDGVGMSSTTTMRPGKPVDSQSAGSAYATIDAPSMCLGSGCMAWRWSHQDTGPTDAPTGFCGAFGLPKYF